MEVVVGLSGFISKWPNKHSGTERRGNCAIFLNRPSIKEKRISDTVNVRCCAPGVNALCAANLMGRRAIAAICADEYRRIYFTAKILQKSSKDDDCTRHVMGKLAQQQRRLTTIHQHQFGERKMSRQPRLLRLLPAADFVKETRQTMNVARNICFRFSRPQQ